MCQCPCETNEFKLVVGKTYLTRKGEKVKIICDRYDEVKGCRPFFYQMIGIFLNDNGAILQCRDDGRVSESVDFDNDLIRDYSEEDERKEKMQKYVEWVKSLKVDDKVEVADNGMYFIKRHFAKVSARGFLCFDYGNTSYTTDETTDWKIIKHPDGTEIKFEDIKEWL